MTTPQPEGDITQVPSSTKSVEDTAQLLTTWTRRLKKAADNLQPYLEQEKRLWEYWHMWAVRQGPFLSNYVPPDGHAAIESITPRLTKQRPELSVIALQPESVGKEPHIERLDRYAWQELHADETFERFVKRGLWLDFAVAKLSWETQTETTYEDQPVMQPDPMTGQMVQVGVEQVPVVKAVVNRPVEELIDSEDFIYPLGYSTWESLPWAGHKITKWRSEIDESLYDAEALKQLDSQKNYKPQSYKTDRLRVRQFPEPLASKADSSTASYLQVDEQGAGNTENDYLVVIHEVYVRGTRDLPQGRRISIGNEKVLLRTGDNPTPGTDLPFYGWTPLDDTYHLRGMGLMRAMEKGLLYKKRQRDQRLDNVDLIINSGWLVDVNEDVDDDEFTSYPGSITRVTNINTAARPKVVPDATASSVREEQIIDRDLSQISAANEYTIGSRPQADRTATEVATLASSSNERYDGIIRRLNRALNRRGKLLLGFFQANWDAEQVARVIGKEGSAEFFQITPEEFSGDFDLQYDVRPSLATKEVVRSQVMEAIGVLSKLPPSPFMGPVNLKPLIETLLGTFEELKINTAEVLTDPAPPGPPPVDPLERGKVIAQLLKSGVNMPDTDIDAVLTSLGLPPLGQPMPNPQPEMPPEAPNGLSEAGTPPASAPTLPTILGQSQTI